MIKIYNNIHVIFNISGDKIVAHTVNNLNFGDFQDVEQNIWYPASGIGDVVSYVEIWVNQNSKLGNAFLTKGGIGQRQISVKIEAKHTTFLYYRVVTYGYKA